MMEGARVLVQMICALATLQLGSATTGINLYVSGPRYYNCSYAALICAEYLSYTSLLPAVFMKDGAPSHQVQLATKSPY